MGVGLDTTGLVGQTKGMTNKAHSVRLCGCGTMVGTTNGVTVNVSQQYASGYYSRGIHTDDLCNSRRSAIDAKVRKDIRTEHALKVGRRYIAMIKASDLSTEEKVEKMIASQDWVFGYSER